MAIYQYMRLLGYPAEKITILTTYAGQRALVRDVLSHRCARNPIFGLPKAVATVDKYQGEQNDCKFDPKAYKDCHPADNLEQILFCRSHERRAWATSGTYAA